MSWGITDPVDAESAANKANKDGSNITNPADWREALDVPSANATAAAIAPKATAGGVRFDGNSGFLRTLDVAEMVAGPCVVAFWMKVVGPVGNSERMFQLGETDVSNTTFLSTDVIQFFVRTDGGHGRYNWHFPTDGEWHFYAFSFDFSDIDSPSLSIDGEEVTRIVNTAPSGNWVVPTGTVLFAGTVSFSFLPAEFRDVTFHNRGLDADEMAILHRDGLAAVQELGGWGETKKDAVFLEGIGSYAATSFATTSPSGYTAVIDGDGLRAGFSYPFEVGPLYEVTFDITEISADQLDVGASNSPNSAGGNLFDFPTLIIEGGVLSGGFARFTTTGSKRITFGVQSGATAIRTIVGGSSGQTITIENFVIKQLGTLAAHPMDDGNNRVLHDLSPNNFHGLLSATGCEHLIPKSEGAIAAPDTDTSATGYLLDSADDLLDPDTVITEVCYDGRIYYLHAVIQDVTKRRIRLAVSGSELIIQRSDGSTHEQLVLIPFGAKASADLKLYTSKVKS